MLSRHSARARERVSTHVPDTGDWLHHHYVALARSLKTWLNSLIGFGAASFGSSFTVRVARWDRGGPNMDDKARRPCRASGARQAGSFRTASMRRAAGHAPRHARSNLSGYSQASVTDALAWPRRRRRARRLQQVDTHIRGARRGNVSGRVTWSRTEARRTHVELDGAWDTSGWTASMRISETHGKPHAAKGSPRSGLKELV
jgi:hypothetical protein